MEPSSPRLSTAVTLSIVAFVGLLAVLVTFLIWSHRDPSVLVSFVIAIVPATVGVILIGHRMDGVQQSTDTIADHVNGKLDAKFAAIHTRLDSMEASISANTATINETGQQNNA